MIERITANPRVCHGKPCVRGTRIMVTLVLELLEAGYTFDQIIEAYPQLTEKDIQACATNLPIYQFTNLPIEEVNLAHRSMHQTDARLGSQDVGGRRGQRLLG
ncbi:MAG: DUF433 domain-containing protein [Anaerolineae bacterium]|nr:DUF433 domain-containing protein [Anaerolineae bacterium]